MGERGIQAVAHLNGQIQEALELHGLAVDEEFRGCAIEILYGDESFAVRFADIVNGADVGMV